MDSDAVYLYERPLEQTPEDIKREEDATNRYLQEILRKEKAELTRLARKTEIEARKAAQTRRLRRDKDMWKPADYQKWVEEQGILKEKLRQKCRSRLDEAMANLAAQRPKDLFVQIEKSRLEILSTESEDLDAYIDMELEASSTTGDLIAISNAIHDNVKAGKPDPMSFLTTSKWGACSSLAVSVLSFYYLYRRMDNAQKISDILTTDVVSATGQLTQSTAQIAAFFSSAAGLQFMAQGGGIAAGMSQLYQGIRDVNRLTTIEDRLKKTYLNRNFKQFMETHPSTQFLVKTIEEKIGRRVYRAGMNVEVGMLSTAQGIFSIVVLAGVFSLPGVGWALFGLTALGGLGMLAHRVYRRVHNKEVLRKLGETDPEIKKRLTAHPWILTIGDYYRFQLAEFMYRAALNDPDFTENEIAAGKSLGWVIFGGRMEDSLADIRGAGIGGIMFAIKG